MFQKACPPCSRRSDVTCVHTWSGWRWWWSSFHLMPCTQKPFKGLLTPESLQATCCLCREATAPALAAYSLREVLSSYQRRRCLRAGGHGSANLSRHNPDAASEQAGSHVLGPPETWKKRLFPLCSRKALKQRTHKASPKAVRHYNTTLLASSPYNNFLSRSSSNINININIRPL